MRVSFIFLMVLLSSVVQASPAALTYQGRILKSDGTPLEHTNVAFIFQIMNPAGTCILYQEQFTGYSMASSKGVFDVPIGSGTVSWPTSGGFSVLDAFNNSSTYSCGACSGYTCTMGSGSYGALGDDGRVLRVQFHDGNGWKVISPNTTIRSVPFAGYSLSAQKLGQHDASAFILKNEVNSNTSCGGGGQFLTWNATTKTFGCSGVSGSNGGTVTTVTAASPLSISAGTESSTPHISMQVASGSQGGYLTSGDWTSFNNKLGPATIFVGDVSGTASNISVDKIKGVTVSTSGLAAGDVLKYSGGQWVNGALSVSDIPGLSVSLAGKPEYSQFPTTCTAAQTLTFVSPVGGFSCTNIAISGSQVSGNISGTASGFTGSLSGDVTGTQAATVVGKLQGVAVSATAPTNNQVLKYNGSTWAPATLGSSDLPSGTLSGSGTTGRLPYYSAANVLSDSVVSQSAGQVGIGTTSPEGLLDVRGKISVGGAHSNVANPNATLVVRSYDNPHLIFEKTGYNTGGIAVDDNNMVFASETADITFRTGVDYNGDFASTGSEILRIKNNGQVGIGTSTPEASAILDLVSLNKGLLAPRMTETQRDAIATPAAGLMVYNTTSNAMNIFNGTSWGALGAGAIGNNTVTTAHLQNNSVTLDKIDFSSTSKGLGLPQMTTTQMNAIGSPVAGMMVFNTTTGTTQVYDGSGWKDMASDGPVTTAKILDGTILGADLNFTGVNSATSSFVLKTSGGQFADFACSTVGHVPTWTATGFACQEPTGTSGTNNTMVSGWPDAIRCAYEATGTPMIFYYYYATNAMTLYMAAYGGGSYMARFNADGSYNAGGSGLYNGSAYNCVNKSIAQLTAAGQTFNFAKGPAGQWLQAGTSAYYNAGNVGIGTASPVYKLDLVDGTARIYNTVGTDADLRFANNTSTAGMIRYSSSDMQLFTGGAQRMVVNGSGNVGIGVTTPGALLDVSGNGIIRVNSSGSNPIRPTNGKGLELEYEQTNDRSNIRSYDRTASAYRPITINGSNVILNEHSGGNVGIGATAPTSRLEVVSNSTDTGHTLKIDSGGDSTGEHALYVLGRHNSQFQGDVIRAAVNRTVSTEFNLIKTVIDEDGTPSYPFVVRGDGNVGIGTSVPAAPLHIRGAGGGYLTFGTGTVTSGYTVDMSPNDDGFNFSTASTIRGYNFKNGNGTLTTISASGSVGIGTTSPSYKLHVVGTAGLSTGTAWTNASDLRLKDIHGDYRRGLDEILQLHTVLYNYKKGNALGLPSDFVKTGFIAQEVQKVIPEAVNKRDDGYLELNVDPIHWAVVNAIKELYHRWFNDSQDIRRELASVKAENEALKAYLCSKDPKAPICK